MSDEINSLLRKAEASLRAANLLYRENFYDFAASRAYYAMFYLTEAFLTSKGLSFSSHAAVTAAFGREFAKANIVDAKFHRYLLDAEDLRHIGDYDVGVSLTAAQVSVTLAWAAEFLAMAQSFFSYTTGDSDV